MQNMFNKCPACGGELIITECRCQQCNLQMRGEFQTGQLASLSEDELTFVQVFLFARGNLSEVERILGISYPTIRNKLDEINEILKQGNVEVESYPQPLGTISDAKTDGDSRKEILRKVADGEISPVDAVEIFNGTTGESTS